MKRAVRNKTGIRWTVFEQLEDLEFADDICLLNERDSICRKNKKHCKRRQQDWNKYKCKENESD